MAGAVALVASVASAAFAGGSIVGAIIKAVVLGALSFLSQALTPKPKVPSFGQQLTDRTVSARQPIAPRRTIYGRARVGGVFTYITTKGGDKKELHMVVTISGHQVAEIERVYFDGQTVTLNASGEAVKNSDATSTFGSRGTEFAYNSDEETTVDEITDYNGKAEFYFRHGEADQTAIEELIAATADLDDAQRWTEEHRQRGCAHVYMKLTFDNDIYPNGIPDISFLVRGKNDIYDPRTETYGYTENAALCIADYLATTEPLGIGALYDAEISTPDLIEAANICDEQVQTDDTGNNFEARYTINGAFEGESAAQVIPELAGAMAGAVVLQGTTFLLRAGAYRLPTAHFTEDDIVDSITFSTLRSRADSFNGVRGIFADPDQGYQPTDFPSVEVAEYVTEDAGEEIYNDIELNYTTSGTMAQRIARILLEEQRRQITASVVLKSVGYRVRPYDTITLTIDRYGWDAKTFRVLSVELNPDVAWSVVVELVEIDANVYGVNPGDLRPTIAVARTSLPALTAVKAPSLAVTDYLSSVNAGVATTTMRAKVTPPPDAFVDQFELEYRKTTDTEWTFLGRASQTVFEISGVEDLVEYEVRARSVSLLGVRSGFVTVSHTVVGATLIPDDVQNFRVSIGGENATLSWDAVDDIDLSHYQIRYSPAVLGASWESSILLVDRTAGTGTTVTVPALIGTYMIKAVDLGGRVSQNAALMSSTIADTSTRNVIETIDGDPDWIGTHDQTEIVSDRLRLQRDSDLFAQTDFFEPENFFSETPSVYREGAFTFSEIVDLGGVFTSRLTASFIATAENLADDFFARTDFFGTADFFSVTAEDWSAFLEHRSTLDDPAGSPVWTSWTEVITTDITARAFEFRIRLASATSFITPTVFDATISVDMPDQSQGENDLVVTTGGLSVTYPFPFNAVKAVAVSAQGLQTGDYYEITNKSATGFDIVFKDVGGSPVQRSFDYVALGYGKQIA